MTLAGSNSPSIFGSFALPATSLFNASTFTGTLYFESRSTGKTIDFNGTSFPYIVFNGLGGGWILSRATTVTGSTFLNSGLLDLNGFVFSTPTFSSNNSNTRSIAFGSGSISLTGNSNAANITLWDMQTITGFTCTGTPTVNVPNTSTNSGFTRTFNHGTAIPGETTAISLNIQAGNTGSIVSISGSFIDLNFAGCSSTSSNTTKYVYGNLTLSSGMTYTTGTNYIYFASTSATTRTITSNGANLNQPIAFNGAGGTWQLQDALTTSATIEITNGAFNSNNNTVTCSTFSYSSSGVKSLILGTSTVTITGGSSVSGFIGAGNNTTYSMSSATVVFTTTGDSCYANGNNTTESQVGTVTINGVGCTLYLGGTTARCGTLNNSAGKFCTIVNRCSSGFTVDNFAITGSLGAGVVIKSDVTGTARTISQTSGTTVNAYYLAIKDTVVTGGAVWNAYNSAKDTNNTGWNFLGNVVIPFTTASTFIVPVGVTSLKLEAIGYGGRYSYNGLSAQYSGGGGGAYAKTNSVAVIPGSLVYVQVSNNIDPAGSDVWINTSNNAPTDKSTGVLAKAGQNGLAGGAGGSASTSIGDIKYKGGDGGLNGAVVGDGSTAAGGGSGGAAGPNGPGGNGGAGNNTRVSGGGGGGGAGVGGAGTGGGASGSNSNAGGAGGNNAAGVGGAGAVSASAAGLPGSAGGGGSGGSTDNGSEGFAGGAGGAGIVPEWVAYGPGGGGGGGGSLFYDTSSGAGIAGSYGGGGDNSGVGNGLAIITYYTDGKYQPNNFFLMF
jgi:hypothetical protein